MEKSKRPTIKQILVLRELVNFICQECNQHEDKVGKLTPHRILRGCVGGTYYPSNIKMVCSKCHLKFHGLEFRNK